MGRRTYKQKDVRILIPVFGVLIFIILYIIATFFYPGGSQADKNSTGFSWLNNYWCNLLNESAINGQHNTAKPFAIAGMLTLCFALSFFWLYFPRYINIGKRTTYIIQISGTLAMAVAVFLFTNINHDLVINLASAFGVIAVIGTLAGLYKIKWYTLFAFGLFNILLVVLNNYVYYSKDLIIYLPFIQKISFLSFLIWICCININLYCNTNYNNHL